VLARLRRAPETGWVGKTRARPSRYWLLFCPTHPVSGGRRRRPAGAGLGVRTPRLRVPSWSPC